MYNCHMCLEGDQIHDMDTDGCVRGTVASDMEHWVWEAGVWHIVSTHRITKRCDAQMRLSRSRLQDSHVVKDHKVVPWSLQNMYFVHNNTHLFVTFCFLDIKTFDAGEFLLTVPRCSAGAEAILRRGRNACPSTPITQDTERPRHTSS